MQRLPGATPAMRASRLVQDTVIGYGMGWQIMDYRGHPVLWHTGNGDGQIAYMALLPRDKLGVVVVVNTWSAPFVHRALISRFLDVYLGYETRDWAGDALARVPAMLQARDSVESEVAAIKSAAPPPLPFHAYAGRYDEPLFGPILVRASDAGLTLQMGDGQIADLEHHGENSFWVFWRDPYFATTSAPTCTSSKAPTLFRPFAHGSTWTSSARPGRLVADKVRRIRRFMMIRHSRFIRRMALLLFQDGGCGLRLEAAEMSSCGCARFRGSEVSCLIRHSR